MSDVVGGTDPFVTHRSLLFTVAYEMLGSAADAEDAVQETWLRWAALEDEKRAEVRDPRAYLVRIATRQSLNRLRTLARRKEDYVGEWLPEPLLTSPDVAEDVELAESVSIAMLTVLETLTPTERAVFVLREVFDLPYDEIAEAVEKSAAAVRQIAHRAREHVRARQPRVEVDHVEQREVLDRFRAILEGGGDVQALMDVLAPEVVLIPDGGGIAAAARKPIHGADRIAAFLSHFRQFADDVTIDMLWVNGAPAMRMSGPEPIGTTVLSILVDDGRITRMFAMRNPQKLARLDVEVPLGR